MSYSVYMITSPNKKSYIGKSSKGRKWSEEAKLAFSKLRTGLKYQPRM